MNNFFFFYKNVSCRLKSDQHKATGLLTYLKGGTFDYYYDHFSNDGVLTKEALELSTVRQAFLDDLGGNYEVQDIIHSATAAQLDGDHLMNSLRNIYRLYNCASTPP